MRDLAEGLAIAIVLIAFLFVLRGCMAGCNEEKNGTVECKTSGTTTVCYSRTYNTWLMKYEIDWRNCTPLDGGRP